MKVLERVRGNFFQEVSPKRFENNYFHFIDTRDRIGSETSGKSKKNFLKVLERVRGNFFQEVSPEKFQIIIFTTA